MHHSTDSAKGLDDNHCSAHTGNGNRVVVRVAADGTVPLDSTNQRRAVVHMNPAVDRMSPAVDHMNPAVDHMNPAGDRMLPVEDGNNDPADHDTAPDLPFDDLVVLPFSASQLVESLQLSQTHLVHRLDHNAVHCDAVLDSSYESHVLDMVAEARICLDSNLGDCTVGLVFDLDYNFS